MATFAADQQFQQLIFQSVTHAEAFCQTQSSLSSPSSPPNSPNSSSHKCECSLSSISLRSEQQLAQANSKAVRQLQFEIRKLKMQMNLLRLQNEVLGKNCNIQKDEYYEGVINGMQAKIEELMMTKQME